MIYLVKMKKPKEYFKIDGVKFEIQPPDYDGDGVTGGIEQVQQQLNNEEIFAPSQPTELGEITREMNLSTVDKETGFNNIDLRSNLHPAQISAISRWETLKFFKAIPSGSDNLTIVLKRNAVSENALGRKQTVQLTQQSNATASEGGPVRKFFGMARRE